MKKLILGSFVALLLVLTSCTAQRKPVQNVIYLIGDGMGFGAVSSLLLSESEVTGFEMAPVIGLNETCSANNYVTDSPAGGTALATGTRTCNGYMGVDPQGQQLESILKKAQQWNKKTGIVVNTVLTEATPGAFYAGVKKRSESYRIAEQFVESGVDVAIGSGLSAFINRPDSVDLTASLIEKGYDVYLDWKSVLQTTSQRFVGILPMSDVHRRNKPSTQSAGAADGAEVCLAARLAASQDDAGADTTVLSEPNEYLAKAVKKALSVLEKDSPDGFFLMVESAIIDGYGHNNDSEGMIEEMQEFNQTLKALVAYVQEHPNTLLVVTADHETGGTSVAYKSHEVGETVPLQLSFSTKGHTGTVVPVFAYGAGAEAFAGIMKNTDIPKRIENLIK
ncbi:MAG: alkaline phosphatase [Bacteroidales bacterium]|nr:alkaline phosphatase [Bacteroidales bacterium]